MRAQNKTKQLHEHFRRQIERMIESLNELDIVV